MTAAPALPDEVRSFQEQVGFELDEFQIKAATSIADGRGVLVAAPTGAGKTLVADFAMYLTMQSSDTDKIFYTTPIKALSNQKFHELRDRYGADAVGLLTGDNNINASGRIVVMTTEVLRNMIYERSERLDHLAYVVMDEVHYLADRFRGPVWEEVIIQLPERIRIISLSATVSNAEEFGAWLQEVRGHTDVIVSEYRPVPLDQHVFVRGGLVDLFDPFAPPGAHRINERLKSLAHVPQAGRGRRGRPRVSRRIDRGELVTALDDNDLLPVICFIFSRAGCDAAVHQCMLAGIALTTSSERGRIREIVERHCVGIPEADRHVLGYARWRAALERGVAAHHAGLLPAFKETVEELFQRRLVRVVFATETLALGINMPARTVALESLEKFNGVSKVPITAGEYTQLTGRAGRRGIDSQGHAVIAWQPGMDLQAVAALASKRTYPLNSSFHPTYNMAVNLIAQFGVQSSRDILESSFAQFQADRRVVGTARNVREMRRSMEGFAVSAGFERPGVQEYFGLQHELTELERRVERLRKGVGESERNNLLAAAKRLRQQIQAHPEHHTADRASHAKWARRWWQLHDQVEQATAEISRRTSSIARTFDHVIEVLTQFGYLDLSDDEVVVTQKATTLRRIYGERDLLVAECLHRGVWASLDDAQLAALVATLVFEPRRDRDDVPVSLPQGPLQGAFADTVNIWYQIDDAERMRNLPLTRQPEAQIAFPVLRWARGAALERVLDDAGILAGDFVRLMKTVVDLLDQIAQADNGEVGRRARTAIDRVRRDIVEYSSVG